MSTLIGSEAVSQQKLDQFEIKLSMPHQRHDLRIHAKFRNSATYRPTFNS